MNSCIHESIYKLCLIDLKPFKKLGSYDFTCILSSVSSCLYISKNKKYNVKLLFLRDCTLFNKKNLLPGGGGGGRGEGSVPTDVSKTVYESHYLLSYLQSCL